MDAMVLAVDSVVFNQTKSQPPLLLLQAKGRVNTGGWSNGRLSPHVYINSPNDGIWDFSFIATMPSGPAIQVLSAIDSSLVMLSMPEWCKGVRVHGSTNSIETSTVSAALAPDGLVVMNRVPFPWDGFATATERTALVAFEGGAPQPFPWAASLPDTPLADVAAGDTDILDKPIRNLIGRTVRVYHEGEMVTMDHVPDRVNIIKSRFRNVIEKVKLG